MLLLYDVMLPYIGRCATLYRQVCYFIEAGGLLYIGRCATLSRQVCYFIEAGVLLYRGMCATSI